MWFSPAPPPSLSAQLGRLRAAFPDYEFMLTRPRGMWRFEVRRLDGRPGLYALITTDPGELWHALAQTGRAPPA